MRMTADRVFDGLSDSELQSNFQVVLEHYTANGEMPNYRQMVDMFGLSSTSAVKNRLEHLHRMGLLEERPAGGGYRIPPAHLKIEYVKL